MFIWRPNRSNVCFPFFSAGTPHISTVTISPPVRRRTSPGISSLPYRRKCLTRGHGGALFYSAWHLMRASSDKRAELGLSSGPPRHPIQKGTGVTPRKAPALNLSLLQLIAPVRKSVCHNLKFPHCTFFSPPPLPWQEAVNLLLYVWHCICKAWWQGSCVPLFLAALPSPPPDPLSRTLIKELFFLLAVPLVVKQQRLMPRLFCLNQKGILNLKKTEPVLCILILVHWQK